jgi:hypothetical protein
MESEKTSKKYKIDEKSLEYLDIERVYEGVIVYGSGDRSGITDTNFSGELKQLFEDAENVLHETIGDKLVLVAFIDLAVQFIDFLVADFNEKKKYWNVEMWRLHFFAE